MRRWSRGMMNVLVLMLVPVVVNAAEYYVAKTGNNSGDGSVGDPWLTLNYASSQLAAGDILYIKAGTYNENLDNVIPSGTSWANATTIAAYQNDVVTVAGIPASFRTIYISNRQYIIIRGLIVEGTDGIPSQGGGGECIKSENSDHIRVSDCELRNARNQGFLISKGSFFELLNLTIHNNGIGATSNQVHGIYFSGTANSIVDGCRVYDNHAFGIHLWHNTQSNNNNIIRNNTTYGNGASGIIVGGGVDNLVYNNVAYQNGFRFNGSGVTVGFGASPDRNQLYNNTTYDNVKNGIDIVSGTGTVVKNNIAFNNNTSPQINDAGSGTIISNNLTTDPVFVNATTNDFHLQSNSPAIGKGVPLTAVTTDFDGKPRDPSAPDIGAFEFGASTTPPPEPPSLARSENMTGHSNNFDPTNPQTTCGIVAHRRKTAAAGRVVLISRLLGGV
ncbi:MAG: right-handed parallel beta-helix repeat-containing protein [Myxococcota bacterium]